MYTRTRNLTVALVSGVLAAPLILSGCSSGDQDSSVSSESSVPPGGSSVPQTTVTATDAPGGEDSGDSGDSGGGSGDEPVPAVNTDGLDPTRINADSVRGWSADVAAGDTAALTGRCWTLPAVYVESHYVDVADRIAGAVTTTPTQAQDGYVWATGSATEVRVPWSEGESEYACPTVVLDGDHTPVDTVVLWTAKRFLLREQGAPVNPADTEDAYPLRCAYTQDPVDRDAVEAADPEALQVTGRGEGRWSLRTTGATVDMRVDNGRVCVAGVAADI